MRRTQVKALEAGPSRNRVRGLYNPVLLVSRAFFYFLWGPSAEFFKVVPAGGDDTDFGLRYTEMGASLVAQRFKSLQCRRPRFDPWIGKIPWRREWLPLQYSWLENPLDRGAQWATVHGVTKSWTQWNQLSMCAHTHTHAHTHTCTYRHTHVRTLTWRVQRDSPRGDGLKSARAVLAANVATTPVLLSALRWGWAES